MAIMAKLVVGINDLQTTHPELSSQALGWDPRTISAGSKKKQKWICSLSHEWHAEIKSRTRQKSGCPVCFGRVAFPGFNDLQTKYPEIAKQAFGWDPSIIRSGSHKKLKWLCSFNHLWEATPNHRTSRGDGCPECAVSGFKSNLDGYLYLIFNDRLQMFKVGITNNIDKRLHAHELLGWKKVEVLGPKNGKEIRYLERSILKSLKSKGIGFPNKNIQKFNGYTEAWSKSEFFANSIDDLLGLMQ